MLMSKWLASYWKHEYNFVEFDSKEEAIEYLKKHNRDCLKYGYVALTNNIIKPEKVYLGSEGE